MKKRSIKYNDQESYIILTTCITLAKLRLINIRDTNVEIHHKIDNSENLPQSSLAINCIHLIKNLL